MPFLDSALKILAKRKQGQRGTICCKVQVDNRRIDKSFDVRVKSNIVTRSSKGSFFLVFAHFHFILKKSSWFRESLPLDQSGLSDVTPFISLKTYRLLIKLAPIQHPRTQATGPEATGKAAERTGSLFPSSHSWLCGVTSGMLTSRAK